LAPRGDILDRVRGLVGHQALVEPRARFVVAVNFWVSVALTVALAIVVDVRFPWPVVVVPPLFVVLTGCLFFRSTIWIPAALVSVVDGALVGGVAGLGSDRWLIVGFWPGAIAGFAAGVGATVWAYQLVRRRGQESAPAASRAAA
jgi:hypothetical protein